MSSISFRTPIPVEVLQSDDRSLELRDRSTYSKILLRERKGEEFSGELGVKYGESKLRTDGTLVCGSRPGEWTFYNPSAEANSLIQTLETYGERVALTNLTHGRALMSVEGNSAGSLLEKICNIDFSDAMVPDGASFSASVGAVSCDLVRADSDQVLFLLSCERSFGLYLFKVLADAGKEFGLIVPPELDLH
jgi:heterotetrameric sarcosine oxidase gamma subunit